MGKATTEKKIRIYLVDDHEIVRRGLVQFINGHDNLEVCGESSNANTAIARINEAKPDVAIIDLSLEGTSGIDLIKAVKSRHPHTRILTLTMHSESEYIKRALNSGSEGYVLKSEPAEQIIEAIDYLMSGKTYMSACLREKILDVMTQPKDSPENLIGELTDREFEILKLIGKGCDRSEISRELNIRASTIGTYRDRLKHKLNLASSGELMKFAVEWIINRDE